jgi:hypothetical protein
MLTLPSKNKQKMQVTTVSLFRFEGWKARFWALSQMGLAPRRLGKVEGLQFIKFLGSGAERGFSIWPNWGQYGILAIWDNEQAAEHFLANNPVFQDYCKQSAANQSIFLHNTMAHGAWDGANPFEVATPFDPNAPIAVLTRATIRWRFLWRFWRQVPQVSQAILSKPGLQFAVGVGELPLVQQATFSLWQSGKNMMDYAYKGPQHAEVIRQTRTLGWYKEELFARFVPYKMTEGTIFAP